MSDRGIGPGSMRSSAIKIVSMSAMTEELREVDRRHPPRLGASCKMGDSRAAGRLDPRQLDDALVEESQQVSCFAVVERPSVWSVGISLSLHPAHSLGDQPVERLLLVHDHRSFKRRLALAHPHEYGLAGWL